MTRHLAGLALIVALALTNGGCATLLLGAIGAAGCGGNSSCLGDALSAGASIDGAIIGGMMASAQRASARPTPHSYQCVSSDRRHQFWSPSRRTAAELCRTHRGTDPTLVDEGCECEEVPAPVAKPLSPPTAGDELARLPDALPPQPYAGTEVNVDALEVPPPPPDTRAVDGGPGEDEVADALRMAELRARSCNAGRFGTVGTDVVFGNEGVVRAVVLHVAGMPPAMRTCVVDAMGTARVTPFERPTFSVRYPVRL